MDRKERRGGARPPAGVFARISPTVLGLLIVLGGSAAFLAAWSWRGNGGGTQEFITVEVRRGDVEDLVAATGALQPRNYVDVGAQVSGQLEKIHVEIGQVVKKGRSDRDIGFVGMDVSKATLDTASLPAGEPGPFTNDEAGIAAAQRPPGGADRAGSDGGYETALAAGLVATGLPVVVINLKRVRDFAKASGILAKTDKIDARGLARFGECIQLLDRRMQLVLMRAQESARLTTVLLVARRDI